MNSWGEKSLAVRKTIHPDLRTLFDYVLQHFDISLLEGFRNEERQNKMFELGFSKVQWPDGNHNCQPSKAVDVCPYPYDPTDYRRFYYLGGFVKATALYLNIPIRYGGDWDGDTEVLDQTFFDLAHYELLTGGENVG